MFSNKQLETIKKVLNEKNKKTNNNKENNNSSVNAEFERSISKEIRDLRTAIKILDTQKAQIYKDSEEINKCLS